MAKVLFYRITHDDGFAPNPYGKYLTLATCTPNHMRANLQKDDWIIGIESKSLARKRRKAGIHPEVKQSLIYIAKITETPITLNEYFRDERFSYKKPKPDSEIYEERRGDNVYYIEDGLWKWIKNHDHKKFNKLIKDIPDEELFFPVEKLQELWQDKKSRKKYGAILQDIRGNRVFISEEFLYFGDMCLECNEKLSPFIPQRGIKYCGFKQIKDYINELIKKYGFGRHGNPILFTIKKLGSKL